MHIDRLEDRILEPRLRAINELCRDLHVSKDLKTLRARVARLKLLNGQLAAK